MSVDLNANKVRAARLVDDGVGLYEAVRTAGLALCLAL